MSEETFVKETNREAVQIEGYIRPEKASGNTTKEVNIVNKESTVNIPANDSDTKFHKILDKIEANFATALEKNMQSTSCFI